MKSILNMKSLVVFFYALPENLLVEKDKQTRGGNKIEVKIKLPLFRQCCLGKD